MGDPVQNCGIDRLLHHAHIINIRGNSYRLKDRLKPGYMLARVIVFKKARVGQILSVKMGQFKSAIDTK